MQLFRAAIVGSMWVCVSCTSGEVSPEPVSVEMTESLTRLGRSGHFPDEIRANEAGLDAFREVAVSHFDPRVVAAGLDALTYHLWEGALDVDEAWLGPLLSDRLAAESPLVVDRAIDLSEAYLTRGGHEVVAPQIAKLVRSHAHGGARFRAVQVLARHSGWAGEEDFVSAMLHATRDEHPWVAAEAYQRLGWSAGEVQDPRAVLRTLLEGAEHPEPSVRGRALRAASQYGVADPWVQSLQRAALQDVAPYVRAEALKGVADGGDVRALSRVVALAGDLSPDVLRLSGWTYLDGRSGMVRLGVSRTGILADAALETLEALTGGMDDAFLRRPLDPKDVLGSLSDEGERAASWYQRHLNEPSREAQE